MKVVETQDEKILYCVLSSKIDASNAYECQEQILHLLDQNKSKDVVMVSFENTEYISSAGLKSLFMIDKECKYQNKRFICINLKEAVFSIFKISGFNNIIQIMKNKEDALSLLH